mmetsp:Transcript_32190/g.48007  ORF Transcript_32190/g.48007 Transcript_32190/m.48007 type:complete len:101 (-) Transcript_32190:217-519(-)
MFIATGTPTLVPPDDFPTHSPPQHVSLSISQQPPPQQKDFFGLQQPPSQQTSPSEHPLEKSPSRLRQQHSDELIHVAVEISSNGAWQRYGIPSVRQESRS